MAMFRSLVLIAALILAPTAKAAETPAKGAQVGQYVDLQPVGLPIVVKGDLLNYVFVNVRVNLTAGADVQKLREKEPFFRDALVREAHRTPFVLASDYEKIDQPRLIAALMRMTSAIAGPHIVQSITILSETPQRRVARPRPDRP